MRHPAETYSPLLTSPDRGRILLRWLNLCGLGYCSRFARFLALVVGSRAADDKNNKKASQQKKETVAKPMTDKQKRAAEDRLRKELASPYKKWLDEDVRWIISDEERTAFKSSADR